MHILLWERNFDTVLAKGVVNAFEDVADDVALLGSLSPYEHLEIDAGVA